MSEQGKFYIMGSGWISALGYGFFGSQPQFSDDDLNFQYPDLLEYIPELPGRFGRFDIYTRLCFSAAVLALKDAGMIEREGKQNVGVIVGSSSGVYDDDLAFFESTRESGGEFASPNLFSYTLPNVALGEIAVFNGFTGPSFCVGNQPDDPGLSVIPAALSLLESGQWERIVVGWVEASSKIKKHQHFPKGAAFSVLSSVGNSKSKAAFTFDQHFHFTKLFGET